jgi:hypothetical protein
MSDVWLLPSGSDSAPDATTEDHLVRVSGDDAEIARVTDAGPEWLGSVPASSLSLPSAGDGPTKVDDPTALVAVQGAASALNQRGG